MSGKSSMMNSGMDQWIAQWFQLKYKEVDKQMSSLTKVCKRGCDWCCYQSVQILNWEEPLILSYISTQLDSDQKEMIKTRLLLWFEHLDQFFKGRKHLTMEELFVDFNHQQDSHSLPCVFLHCHECLIYPVRSLCCRMHIVDVDPDYCIVDPLRDASPAAEGLRKKVLRDIVDQVPTTLRLLNFSIAPLFGLEHRVWPVFYERLRSCN
jgi:Fe-S-cluster containining protein